MALTAHEKKIVVLAQLSEGDRIVRQRASECGTYPDAAWTLRQPQSSVWISTVKWLERHGLIAESIEPVAGETPHGTNDQTRRWYQAEMKHRVYAITQKGLDWFIDEA
ncbi:hypothetical protein [Pelagibacterium lacus]|uniref:Uncharacterized protein n=1 Tax=Pelagibacterium lacus TaxID=2282655 RepID=A0A369W105_9HYPH|nr:hypothetical protein [Pelagibacterium lacus]RDE07719.1 hypothetical protein DVH29_15220 [Pelagibacterium lacus]